VAASDDKMANKYTTNHTNHIESYDKAVKNEECRETCIRQRKQRKYMAQIAPYRRGGNLLPQTPIPTESTTALTNIPRNTHTRNSDKNSQLARCIEGNFCCYLVSTVMRSCLGATMVGRAIRTEWCGRATDSSLRNN
jgi:hypothetical protein